MALLKSAKGSVAVALMINLLVAACLVTTVSIALALITPKLAALCGAELKYDGLQLFVGWFMALYLLLIIIWRKQGGTG